MKKIFLLFMAPVLLLLFLAWTSEPEYADSPSPEPIPVKLVSATAEPAAASKAKNRKQPLAKKGADRGVGKWYDASNSTEVETMITYALSLQGSPYVYGGTSRDGFDCSGFTSHVFESFGFPITRSSTTQAEDGIAVDREEAQPGDLVIFTGTNPSVREPGHVGIVISSPGDTISFVHSSSNGGVKISQVEGTGYERRFLDIRRVL